MGLSQNFENIFERLIDNIELESPLINRKIFYHIAGLSFLLKQNVIKVWANWAMVLSPLTPLYLEDMNMEKKHSFLMNYLLNIVEKVVTIVKESGMIKRE